MDVIKSKKILLRKQVSEKKREYSDEDLNKKSTDIFSIVENTLVFKSAQIIFIYNSLKGEVQTMDFVKKWYGKKYFYMPVVDNDALTFKECTPGTTFHKTNLGVMEPNGDYFTDYNSVDIIIIPGIAFDRNLNRLGRGKGYYDRFLRQISAVKIGICFGFQLFNQIPADANDVKMDYIVTEKEIISRKCLISASPFNPSKPK